MNQVTKVKNKFRLEQWTQLIRDCQASGMKVDDWCAANGVTHHAYYYWLRKVREAACRELAIVDDLPNEPVVLKKLEVSAYAFGPKKLVLIVGMNKVAGDVDSALKRARNFAATMNVQCFGLKTPCMQTGTCIDCMSPDSICCQFLITRYSRHKDRIHVILVNVELGF